MVLRTGRRATCALALASLLTQSACYTGEWKTGTDMPLSTQSRLLPTRDVERWELEPTVTPYVVRLKADITPRCRSARYGQSRRVDTGKFHRDGAKVWRGAAIATGVAGGLAGLTGGSGWIARDGGAFAGPAMYGVGGLIGAGGLVNCILALQKSTKVRWALCGSLLGGGGAIALGAGLASINTTRLDPMTMAPMPAPLVETDVFKGITIAGAATLGVAAITGLISRLWSGETERTRVVESEQTSLWDRQQGEIACGPSRPLIGRTATLEIAAERAADGPGSEAEPLKLRVAVGEEGRTAVDMRPLRQALPECGVLRVQVNPDTLYELFAEDWVPPISPQQVLPTGRPIHGQIMPREGVTLSGVEVRGKRTPARQSVPGFPDEVVGAVARRCRSEVARAPETPPPPPPPPPPPRSAARRPEPGPISAQPQPPPPAPVPAQGGVIEEPPDLPPRRGQAQGPEQAPAGGGGECSPEARQAIQRDCEHSCSKTLEVSSCLFERRKCLIDARYSAQKGRDQELCELGWEKCIFKAGVGPGSWGRCVESCQRKNESVCRERE